MTPTLSRVYKALLVLVFLCFHAGCSTKADPIADDQSESTPVSAKKSAASVPSAPTHAPTVTPLGPKAELKLIEAGREPRTKLRYHLKVGDEDELAMTISTAMKMEIPGSPPNAMKLPKMEMSMQLSVIEKLEAGKFKAAFELTGIKVLPTEGVDDAMAKAMKEGVNAMVGTKGTSDFNERGIQSNAKLEIGSAVEPQIKQMMESTTQSMEQLSSPFPVEPVGVGATWILKQSVRQNGITLNQTTTFKLVELGKTTGKLSVQIEQNAPTQTAELNGLSMKVVSMKNSGQGVINFNRKSMSPDKADVKIEASGKFEMMGQGMTMSSTTQIVTKRQL